MDEKNLDGLTSQQAETLLREHGQNILSDGDGQSLIFVLISQYKNLLTFILFLASLFSFVIGEQMDGGIILLVLLLNGIFGFIQEARAEKTLQKLKDLSEPETTIIRDGHKTEIESRFVVPGDILVLQEGDRIPADGKLLSSIPLEIDESILTGESLPVEKKQGETLFAGTFVVQGRAHAIVSATGFKTKLGEIAAELEHIKKPKTPLQVNLDRIGKQIALASLVISAILIPIGMAQGREFKELVLTTVSVAVAVIPEGLPLVVTMALAVGAFQMARHKTIVKKMAAIETLGATTVILSDKTGTITQNEMRVKRHWLAGEKLLPLLERACVVGNTASLAAKEDGGSVDVLGDKTDGALLLFVRESKPDIESFRHEGKIVEEKPFDPDTKTIEVVWRGEQEYTFVRGAPEKIFELVESDEAKQAEKELEKMAREGLRVIGFAYRSKEKSFKLLGLVALYDAPREEAKAALEEAKKAGIRVVMVTGDNPLTAQKIAEEVGMITEGELVVTSEEITKLTDDELVQKLPKIRIFARMLPHDKLRLVRLYKQAGFVTAVTGDGVNDALALSEAHIGVAMGETGTDVAKEAADVVITDDNLATIIHAVEEGRGIYDNIVKVVIFLFSSNLAEFSIIFLGILLGLPIPLTPTQILWVNLISDGLPAMAMATDSKRDGLLKQKPRSPSESILTFKRLFFISKITIPFSLFLVGIFYFALQSTTEAMARIIVFDALVIGEMMIIFLIRGRLFPLNKFLLISVGVSILMQIAITVNPFLRGLFS